MAATSKILSIGELTTQSHSISEFVDYGESFARGGLAFLGNSFSDVKVFSPQKILQLSRRAAKIYCGAGVDDYGLKATVAIQGKSTVEWVATFVALARLGHPVLVLAPSLSAEIVEELMEVCDCKILINQMDMPSPRESRKRKIIPMAKLCGIWTETNEKPTQVTSSSRLSEIHDSDTAVIMHSSGTTGMPKLFTRSHRQILSRIRELSPGLAHSRVLMGTHLFYLLGFFSMLHALVRDDEQTCWPGERVGPTPEDWEQLLITFEPMICYLKPRVLMDSASTRSGLEKLKQAKMVCTIGTVMPKHLGDKLFGQGVRIVPVYSMTELSLALVGAPGDLDWEYLRIDPMSSPHVQFRPLPATELKITVNQDPAFEFVVLPSHPTQDRRWSNPKDGCFYTGDIFVQHKTKPHRVKPLGRLCEIIYIQREGASIGILPSQYENIVVAANQETVEEAVLFGDGRPDPVMLLFTKEGNTDQASDEFILDNAWKAIEEGINEVLPVALKRHMVLLIRDATVCRTQKEDINRLETFKMFESLIETAYQT